jgi:two-component system, chemotaxis family, chemotaxis protein CheY
VKILVVDDSKMQRLIVTNTAQKLGIAAENVREADNGVDALKLVAEFKPDLLLADVTMPGMSGIDLVESVVAAGSPPKIGIITSSATQEIRDKAKKFGVLFVLAKPFTVNDLKKALEEIL